MIKDPGQLDRKITFEQATATRGANGEQLEAWATYGLRWAKLDSGTGTENVDQGRLIGDSRAVFTVRYDPSISKAMRILYDSKYYNIYNIIPEGRDSYLILDCETTD